MMMSAIWGAMLVLGIGAYLFSGDAAGATSALLGGASSAVTLCLSLAGGYVLWLGLLNIVERSGLLEKLARAAKPLIRRLFPAADEKSAALITLNLSANMLGMGNAATPFGLDAMRQLQTLNPDKSRASNEMCMLLIINSASVQLIPTTLIALRQAAGAADPADIFIPTLIATAASLLFAVMLALLVARRA